MSLSLCLPHYSPALCYVFVYTFYSSPFSSSRPVFHATVRIPYRSKALWILSMFRHYLPRVLLYRQTQVDIGSIHNVLCNCVLSMGNVGIHLLNYHHHLFLRQRGVHPRPIQYPLRWYWVPALILSFKKRLSTNLLYWMMKSVKTIIIMMFLTIYRPYIGLS